MLKNYNASADRFKQLLVTFACSLLIACGTVPSRSKDAQANPIRSTTLQFSEQDVPAKEELPPEDKIFQQQMYLANDYMINGQLQAANQIIHHYIPSTLNDYNRAHLLLIQAKLDLLTGNPKSALQALKSIDKLQLQSNDTLKMYYALKAQAYYRNNLPLSSIITKLNEGADVEQSKSIWQELMDIEYSHLKRSATNQKNPNTKAWLELALIAKHYANSYEQLFSKIQAWQISNPEHPANLLLTPNSYQQSGNSDFSSDNSQIAVLLPLSGKYKPLGTAVQKGITDAFYQNQTNHFANKVNLKFYNTNSFDTMSKLFNQIKADNNQFIIGPLTKENNEEFSRINTGEIPGISLNYSENNKNSSYNQFGLSPLDEANQVAKLAWRLGKSKALIMTPDTTWGQQIKQSFIETWLSLGGDIADEYNYKQTDKFSETIPKYLGITDSEWRSYLLEKSINAKITSIPQHRKDIDMIFLAATPDTAREIKPLLKFNYANGLTVFATSSLYTGNDDNKIDQDLNGIYFCDATWLINPTTTMKVAIANERQLWKSDFNKFIRLYALGNDAFMLSQQQDHLRDLPEFPLVGATGNLYLTEQGKIERQLSCAKFINGKPHAVY